MSGLCLQVMQSDGRVVRFSPAQNCHFVTQPNDVFAVWLFFFIAEFIGKPTYQELKFPIGKVG